MLKILIGLLISNYLWADATLSLPDNSFNIRVGSSSDSSYFVPNTDDTASTPTAYIPYDHDSTNNGDESSLYNTVPNADHLLANTSGRNIFIEFDIDSDDSTSRELWVAIKQSDGKYEVASRITSGLSGDIDSSYYTYTGTSLCTDIVSVSDNNCTTLATEYQSILVQAYFFLAEDGDVSEGQEISSSSEGELINFKIANHPFSVSSKTVTIEKVTRGDGRLTIEYDGDGITDMNRVMLYQRTAPFADDDPHTSTDPSVLIDLETSATSGSTDIKDLTNDQTYYFKILFENKYKFTTKFSNLESDSPMNIEAFLEKQSCFLLSASFLDEHFILDYFRWIRDHVLLKTALGKIFVNWYYEAAPKYAMTIIANPFLGAIIRILAYMAFCVINLCCLLMVFIFIMKPVSKLAKDFYGNRAI